MGSSYQDLKSAFLALQRLATVDRAAWLRDLRQAEPEVHAALRSLLAFEVGPDARVSVDDPLEASGPEPLSGTRYQDRGLLGVGGIGEVRRVYDPSLDRVVALKFLRTRHVDEPDPERRQAAQRRFVTEAQIQASLHHPAILPVYERGTLPDGRPYLTMAEVCGRTLRECVQQAHQAATATETGQDGAEGWTLERLIAAFELVCRAVAHAHERGVLHRDLKPSNIMLDDAGQVWGLDWGLALPRDRGEPAGVAGTPAYMAPEQRVAESRLDERVDVYALGAILLMILTGRDPQPGAIPGEAPGPAELVALGRAAMASEPGDRLASAQVLAEGVRAWLHARQERGGAGEISRRGWRIALLAGVGLAAVLGVALGAWSWLGSDGEAAAQRRLEALRTTVDEHRAAGDDEAVDRAFQTFVDLRENAGTAALARAWRDRAEVLTRRGQAREARRALAMAYVEAQDAEQRSGALLDLIQAQAHAEAWEDLAATLEVLRARLPDQVDAPQAREAAWRLAVATRRLTERGTPPEGPTADLEPMIQALGRAQRLELPGEADVGLLALPVDGRQTLWAARREGLRQLWPPLAQERTRAWPEGVVAQHMVAVQVDGEPHLVVADGQRMALLRWQARAGGGLQTQVVWRLPGDAGVVRLAAGDLDGDGRDEVAVGTFNLRRIDVLDRDRGDGRDGGGEGTWRAVTPEGSVQHANSEVRGLVAEDLDGDGQVELAAALGPWGAYDVRLMRWTGGRLELLSRHKLGALTSLGRMRGSQGLELVATVAASRPRPRDFPPGQVAGARPGLYRMGVRAGELTRPVFSQVGPSGSQDIQGVLPFDMDGDGLDELAVSREGGVWLGRLDRRGGLSGVMLTGLGVRAALDADGDGRDELVVWDPTSEAFWILGLGDDRLPPQPPSRRTALGPLPQGWLSAHGQHTDELAAMGFAAQAARRLAGLAELVDDSAVRSKALTRAARYLERDGQLDAALALYDRATELGVSAPEALQGAARCAAGLHRFEVARDRLQPLGSPDLASLQALADVPRWSGTAADLLDLPHTALDPLGARLDPRTQQLEWTALGGHVLARIPLRRTGERVGILVDAELRELTWSSGLSFELWPRGHEQGPAVWMHGHGGGGHVMSKVGGACGDVSRRREVGRAVQHAPRLGALRLRLDCVPGRDHGVVEVHGLGEPLQAEIPSVSGLPDGDYELVIHGRATADGAPLPARVGLSHLQLVGLEPVPDAPVSTEVQAARALIRGEPSRVLALDGISPTTRALALADLGRLDPALQILQAAERTGQQPPDWPRLLRSRPDLAAALARREGAAALPRLWSAWGGASRVEPDAPDVVRALTEGPLGTLPLDDPSVDLGVELRAQILLARGRSWRLAGRLPRARQALDAAADLALSAEQRVRLSLERARLAVAAQDPSAARAHLQTALEHSPAPEVLRDRMRAEADLPRSVPTCVRSPPLQGPTEPGEGERPLRLHRRPADPERLTRLSCRRPPEHPQLHDVGRAGIQLTQAVQGVVQGQHVDLQVLAAVLGVGVGHLGQAAAALVGLAGAGPIDQHVAGHPGDEAPQVGAVVEVPGVLARDPQVDLVRQLGRLERGVVLPAQGPAGRVLEQIGERGLGGGIVLGVGQQTVQLVGGGHGGG